MLNLDVVLNKNDLRINQMYTTELSTHQNALSKISKCVVEFKGYYITDKRFFKYFLVFKLIG